MLLYETWTSGIKNRDTIQFHIMFDSNYNIYTCNMRYACITMILLLLITVYDT